MIPRISKPTWKEPLLYPQWHANCDHYHHLLSAKSALVYWQHKSLKTWIKLGWKERRTGLALLGFSTCIFNWLFFRLSDVFGTRSLPKKVLFGCWGLEGFFARSARTEENCTVAASRWEWHRRLLRSWQFCCRVWMSDRFPTTGQWEWRGVQMNIARRRWWVHAKVE